MMMMMMICVCVQGPLGVWVWEWVGLNPYRPRWPILVNITDTHPIVLLYKPTFTRLHPQILSSDQKCSSFLGAHIVLESFYLKFASSGRQSYVILEVALSPQKI